MHNTKTVALCKSLFNKNCTTTLPEKNRNQIEMKI